MGQKLHSEEVKSNKATSTVERFKKELLKRREEILGFQHRIEEHGISTNDEPGDLADRSEEVEMWLAKESVNQHVSDELKQIDAALNRIAAGVFGVCESCEEQIPLNRLRARPDAIMCLGCQEVSERSSNSTAHRRPASSGLQF